MRQQFPPVLIRQLGEKGSFLVMDKTYVKLQVRSLPQLEFDCSATNWPRWPRPAFDGIIQSLATAHICELLVTTVTRALDERKIPRSCCLASWEDTEWKLHAEGNRRAPHTCRERDVLGTHTVCTEIPNPGANVNCPKAHRCPAANAMSGRDGNMFRISGAMLVRVCC